MFTPWCSVSLALDLFTPFSHHFYFFNSVPHFFPYVCIRSLHLHNQYNTLVLSPGFALSIAGFLEYYGCSQVVETELSMIGSDSSNVF